MQISTQADEQNLKGKVLEPIKSIFSEKWA